MPPLLNHRLLRSRHFRAAVRIGLTTAMILQCCPRAQADDRVVTHLTAEPRPVAPRPSVDPVDILAAANTLAFTSGHRIRGYVRDASSGQPMAGTWVIAAWEVNSLTADVCIDADAIRSDSAGRFEFSTWRHALRTLAVGGEQRLRLFAYHPRYELVRLERGLILLHPLQDSPPERLAALRLIEEHLLMCRPNTARAAALDAHFRPLLEEMVGEVQVLDADGAALQGFLAEVRRQIAQIASASH